MHVRRERLDNGLTVLVCRDPSAPAVAIVTAVRVGYCDEPDDLVGASHVIEHMYFRGTPTLAPGELAAQTQALGGSTNAATTYDSTTYHTVVPSSRVRDALRLQSDAYANATLDPRELRREVDVIVHEGARKADDPMAVAVERLNELLYDSHRVRRWRIGTEAGVRGLTCEALLEFRARYYHPDNTVLAIVGDVDIATTLEDVRRRYGAIAPTRPQPAPGPSETAGDGFRYRHIAGDASQTQILFGWRTPGTLHADTPALELAGALLGTGRASRLRRAMRGCSLSSTVAACNITSLETGVFLAHAATSPDLAVPVASIIWNQARRLADGDLDRAELDRAKRVYESHWAQRLEGVEGQARYLAEWELMRSWSAGEQFLSSVRGATAADVARVASHWLSPNRAALLVHHPRDRRPIADSAADIVALLDRDAPAAIAPMPARRSSPSRHAGAPPRFDRHSNGVTVYRTATGVPILVRPRRGSSLVHLTVRAAGGVCDESPRLAGITRVMVDGALRGTTCHDAESIADEIDDLGAQIAASAEVESFGWSACAPARVATAAASVLADVVQRPTYEASALRTELAAATARVARRRDDARRLAIALALESVFPGHAHDAIGGASRDSLARISRDDVVGWHASSVHNAPVVIGVVGDADPDALAGVAGAVFSDLKWHASSPVSPLAWPSEGGVVGERFTRNQTSIALTFPAPPRGHDDWPAFAMLTELAGGQSGRLARELRGRRGLTYAVGVQTIQRRRGNAFVVHVDTAPEDEEQTRDALVREIQRFSDEGISADELHRAQDGAVGRRQTRLQHGGAMLQEMIGAWLFDELDELHDAATRLRAVSPSDVRDAARRYLDPRRCVEGIVRGGAPTREEPRDG